MSEFFFVVKTILFSALVLLLLQMKISGLTVEEHFENRIYHSRIGYEMQTVARGAVRAGHDGWDWVKVQTQDKLGSAKASDGEESSARETHRERSSRSRPRSEDLD